MSELTNTTNEYLYSGQEEDTRAVLPLLNHEYYLFIMSISLGIVCQTIVVFGTISNVINIIVFFKQGFSDTINICLLALAISDLCSLLTLMWSNLCFTPPFRDSNLPIVTYEIQLISGSWPHLVFTKVTGWITAFISFERCVCVVSPLKVKALFTNRRRVLAMVLIYVITLGSHSITYSILGYDWVFYPRRNQTLLRQVYLMDENTRIVAVSSSFAVNGLLMPVSCFLSVVICTVFLVVKLNEKAAWRSTVSSVGTQPGDAKQERMSTRDQKIAKLIVLIAAMFVTCFIPAVIIFIVQFIEPDLNYDGPYRNMFLVVFSVSFSTEAINSSVNICIYLTMSTKYRETFVQLFVPRRLKSTS